MGSKLVLVVEDDANSRQSLADLLDLEGIRTLQAQDSVEAVAHLYRDNLPDLILLDIQLPGKGGLELLSELKANVLFRRIPVIIVSGYVDPRVRSKEIVAAFEKPYDHRKLIETIHSTLKSG